jgi:hypothetical protein
MKTFLFVAALGAGFLATGAMAQPVTPPPAAPAMHNRMQADRTRADAQQIADAMFQRFDVNHDGVLTRYEAQAALAQAAAARGGDDSSEGDGRSQRMLDRMFGDAQSATQAQFEAQALARFDREDLNHDGVVTAAERKQGWANRAQ